MRDLVWVTCPWCFESVELAVEPDLLGETVIDCEVCCRPWLVTVARDRYGDPEVAIDRND
jgi:hypothetical protein